MNRNRLEPLGVPHGNYDFGSEFEQQARRSEPRRIDRWLINQLRARLGESRVAITLWDEPVDQTAEATVQFNDRGALWRTLANPALHFGDLYSAGRLTVHGELRTVLDEAYRYLDMYRKQNRLLAGAKLVAPDLSESRRNIHHHYDLGNEFYKLWLDRDWMQYTCAYYPEAALTIEQAQAAKLHHVARKLRLKPGESRTITFRLPADMLAFYDDLQNLILEPGRIELMLGSSSEDIRLRGSFELSGVKKIPVERRLFLCPVDV
jgi:hypothetical protein